MRTAADTCLLLIGDGRDPYRERTIQSAELCLPRFGHLVEIDDSDHSLGFAGAIRQGWEQALETGADFVFHLELDFVFNRPVPVHEMRQMLEQNPHLVQLALLRQPWNAEEAAAGGIVQMFPEDYTQRYRNGCGWLEHRRCFTTNPCLYPAWVMRAGWPEHPESEGHFGLSLFASDPKLRAGYWGEGEEWCEHIGRERVGVGY